MVLLHCILISLNAVVVLNYSAGSKRGILEETDKKEDEKVKECNKQEELMRNVDDFNVGRGLEQNFQYIDAENSDLDRKHIGKRAQNNLISQINNLNNINRGKEEDMQINDKKEYKNIVIIFIGRGLHRNIKSGNDQDILVKDKKKDKDNIFDDQELYTESGRRWFSMVYQLLRKYALGEKTSLVPIF